MKKIAVLLPVYRKDNPKYFTTTLESLMAQTYQEFSIFLGVDGPIDGDLEIAVK